MQVLYDLCTGVRGSIGEKGSLGKQGEKGDQGSTGVMGPPGPSYSGECYYVCSSVLNQIIKTS